MIISLADAVALFRPEDRLAVPLATGQPMALMNALSERTDWKRLEIFTGLLAFPYPILTNPNVFMTSGYYGPIERFLNESGANVDYLPANFTGFEIYARRKPPRVLATTVSAPDKEGYVTFGTHCGAMYRPFVEACRDQSRIAIAEINPQMPVMYGDPACGDNKIKLDDIPYAFWAESSPLEPQAPEPTEAERKIAANVLPLVNNGATLQFGIGAVPDLIAKALADSSLGDFGIHSELVSDGFLKLVNAGKITNARKGVYAGQSVFTFAFGSRPLYDFLDERKGQNARSAICLPVSVVNDPYLIAKNTNMVSINSGLMIDLAGQVCSEAIGRRQYSGVGGQLSFVEGAYYAANGVSVMCVKSTATVDGKLVSNIVATLPAGSLVSTPRHFTQIVVTEYGVADLYGVTDEKRPENLIAIAHPEFRDQLRASWGTGG